MKIKVTSFYTKKIGKTIKKKFEILTKKSNDYRNRLDMKDKKKIMDNNKHFTFWTLPLENYQK